MVYCSNYRRGLKLKLESRLKNDKNEQLISDIEFNKHIFGKTRCISVFRIYKRKIQYCIAWVVNE